MFKAIKRLILNLFWKEKRVVSIPKPTRESTHPFAINDNKFFPVVGEEDRCSNNVQEEGLAASSFEASKRLEDAIKRGDPTEIHYAKLNKVLADGRACGTKLTPEEVQAILGDANNLTYHLDNEAYEESLRQPKDDLISPAQAAYDMAAALKGSALTQEEKDELDKELPHILSGNFALPDGFPNMESHSAFDPTGRCDQSIGRMSSDRLYQNQKRQLEDEAGDETYALEAGHVMSQEAASMYRTLCNLKHHQDFQTPESRKGLFSLLNALETGEWDPEKAQCFPDKLPVVLNAELRIPHKGLVRDHIHIQGAATNLSKSVFHSGNSLQNEVDHLITIDPLKFCSEDRAEVDMVVKKLGDELDCRVTKVKVVKRRLRPLSKNEASKMSPRRRKKETKKVIEVNRGKHRG